MAKERGSALDLSDSAALTTGQKWLLVIGIDQYQHCPRLYNAVRDARAFTGLLQEKYGFSGENTRLIELYDEAATRKKIQTQLQYVAEHAKPEDDCIIYFSGHGAYNRILHEGFWIPADAEEGDYSDFVPNAVIQRSLDAMQSRHIFLIADSCFSGAMFTGTGRDAGRKLEKDPSRWGLTSGRNEIVTDGKPGDNSPFSEALLRILRQNEDALGVAVLCARMMEVVSANARQTPRGEPLAVRGHQGGQYVFRPADASVAAWAAAEAANTPERWLVFMEKYPDHPRRPEAESRRAALLADRDWERAERIQTEAAYFHFTQQHPADPRTAVANIRMRALADDRKWQEAVRKGGILDFREYLEAYPKGSHAEAARERIDRMMAVPPPQESPSAPPPAYTPPPPPGPKPKPVPPPTIAPDQERPDIPPTPSGNGQTSRLVILGATALLLLLVAVWKFWPGPSAPPSSRPDPVVLPGAAEEETAWRATQKAGTIPALQNFIKIQYAEEKYETAAKQALTRLENMLNKYLTDANAFSDEPNEACPLLEKAVAIAPDNREVQELRKRLKCK